MNSEEKKYFERLKSNIRSKKSSCTDTIDLDYPLMPLQYCYVHNLESGNFEYVKGVKNVLGFDDEKFTLEFYYEILHPLDRKLVFETSKQSINTVNELKFYKPFGCQQIIVCRIKKSNGEYAKIIRFSTLLTSANQILKTFSICTDISELGLVNDLSASCLLQGLRPYDGKHLLYKMLKKNWGELTPREIQILELVYHGRSTQEISNYLNISKYTVNKHRQNILRKTDKKNLQELIKEIFSVKSDLLTGNI